MISLPLIPTDGAIVTVLSGVTNLNNVNVVWSYEYDKSGNGVWYFYTPGGSDNTLTTIEDGKGYWIDMKNSDTLKIVGSELPKGGPDGPASYPMVESKWNLIGFKSTAEMTAGKYIGDFTDSNLNIDSILWDYKNRKGDGTGEYSISPLHKDDKMQVGYGYWIQRVVKK